MNDAPTNSDPARSLLLDLAHCLRPELEADLSDLPNRLVVRNGARALEVEVMPTVVPATPSIFYRNARSGRIYGTIGHAYAAAKEVRADLRADSDPKAAGR